MTLIILSLFILIGGSVGSFYVNKTNEVVELSHKEAVYKLVPQMHFAKGIKETDDIIEFLDNKVNIKTNW